MSFLMDTAIFTRGEGTSSFDTNTLLLLGGAVGAGVEYRSSASRGYSIDARGFTRAGSSDGAVLETGVLVTASYLVF